MPGLGGGGGDDGRIALVIQTDADLTGIRAARVETRGMAADAQAASAQMAAGASEEVAANQTRAVSHDQMRAALAASNGDLEKAKLLLAQQVGFTQPAVSATNSLGEAHKKTGTATVDAAEKSEAALRKTGLLQVAAMNEDERRSRTAATNAERITAAEASKTAALVRAIEAEDQSAQSMGRAEVAAYAENEARSQGAAHIDKIPRTAQRGTGALLTLTMAAQNGTGSMLGLARSAGQAAFGFSALSSNATLAAGAAGLGAMVMMVTVLYEEIKKLNDEAKITPSALAHIGMAGEATGGMQLDQVRALRDQAAAEAARTAMTPMKAMSATWDELTQSQNAIKRYEQLNGQVEELTKKTIEWAHAETVRRADSIDKTQVEIDSKRRLLGIEKERVDGMTQARSIATIDATTEENASLMRVARYKSEYRIRLDQIEVERVNAIKQIKEASDRNDVNGHKIALNAAELRQEHEKIDAANEQARLARDAAIFQSQFATSQRAAARKAASDNPLTAIQGRLEEIELERQAEIQKYGDIVEAAENAEIKKRKLLRETLAATASSLKGIEDATANSQNSRTKALHEFAKNYRAVIIGAKAAEAAVDSAKAFASVPAHLAVQDYSGAALAALAAAAILGFTEAGGGGGGSSGGGGGGNNSGTFQPSPGNGQGGASVINLYTVNPYSRETMGVVSYELGRAGVLKRPIQLPPTTGLQGAA
jgi:hypothetical protein